MKKTVVSFLFMILCCAMVSGIPNEQKIWPVDCEEFEALEYLYIIQGKALPSTSGPWSNAEMQLMAGWIDPAALDDGARNTYEWLADRLDEEPENLRSEGLGMSWGFDLAVEGYLHTNTDQVFQGQTSWVYGVTEQKPFLNISWETWATKFIYGYFEFGLKNNLHFPESADFGSKPLGLNIIFFPNLELSWDYMYLVDMNLPSRAIFSIGGENWSFEMGRDRLSWGAGETGNLVISDTVPYHNMLRFSTFWGTFKYSFLTSFFPHPMNYDNAQAAWGKGSQNDKKQGLKFYMAHRIEDRVWNERLGFSITEAIMYMSEDGIFDLGIINPMAVFHNFYMKENANSTLTLEVDFAPFKCLNIYAQAMLDDYTIPGENSPKSSSGGSPDAFGWLLGTKTSFSLGSGLFYASVEGAYTDPFLYLRFEEESEQGKQADGAYGINYVVALRSYVPDEVNYDEYFLGYTYGPDAEVLNFNAGWKVWNRISIEGNLFLMAHGTLDAWSCWTETGDGTGTAPSWTDFVTPTSTHNTYNNKDNADARTRDAVSYTTVIGVNVTYYLQPTQKVYCQADLVNIRNQGNHSGRNKRDFQFVFGLDLKL